MTTNISGTGLVVVIRGTTNFQTGLTISQFASDSDPLGIEAIKIAESEMGLNGDLQVWSKAVPIALTLNVIPGSDDDLNLQILGDANRVGQGKVSARDVFTATVIYPDGEVVILTGGILTSYVPGNSVGSNMRIKTKPYMFEFQSKT